MVFWCADKNVPVVPVEAALSEVKESAASEVSEA